MDACYFELFGLLIILHGTKLLVYKLIINDLEYENIKINLNLV